MVFTRKQSVRLKPHKINMTMNTKLNSGAICYRRVNMCFCFSQVRFLFLTLSCTFLEVSRCSTLSWLSASTIAVDVYQCGIKYARFLKVRFRSPGYRILFLFDQSAYGLRRRAVQFFSNFNLKLTVFLRTYGCRIFLKCQPNRGLTMLFSKSTIAVATN